MRSQARDLTRNIADFRCVRYANKLLLLNRLLLSKAAYIIYMYTRISSSVARINYLSMASAAREIESNERREKKNLEQSSVARQALLDPKNRTSYERKILFILSSLRLSLAARFSLLYMRNTVIALLRDYNRCKK